MGRNSGHKKKSDPTESSGSQPSTAYTSQSVSSSASTTNCSAGCSSGSGSSSSGCDHSSVSDGQRCGRCRKLIVRCKRGHRGPIGQVGPKGDRGDSGTTVTLFGNGADGDFTDCSDGPNSLTILDRDYYFQNLELCGRVCTSGFRIFVRNTFTLHLGSIICENGNNGGLESGGNGAPAGTLGGGGSGGGLAIPAQNLDVPIAGGIGGFGNLPPGLPTPFSPSSGGVTINGATQYQDIYRALVFNQFPQNITGRTLNDYQIFGGTGGGSNGFGVPGGGGGGGGVVGIYAYRLAGDPADPAGRGGLIQAKGGNGFGGTGVPQNPPFATGGGGGGAVIVSYAFGNPNAYTYDVSGGAGGGFGQAGNPGNIFTVSITPP